MRWPLWMLRRSIAAEAQAAMIRLTGRGSPAEDTKWPPLPGRLSSGVVAEQATHTARGTLELSSFSVVTTISCAFTHCAWGRGQAESPAFRAPFILKGIKRRSGLRARPRR